MDIPPASRSILPVRLKRETPFQSQLGCTAMLAVLLLGMAVFCYFAGQSPGRGEKWVPYVVAGGFGFFGLLLLWSFIRQLAAVGIRETVVEISTEPLQPGQSAKICLIQPGPARLKSLRANLVRLEERTRSVWNSQKKVHEERREERLVSTENLLETKHLNVGAGDTWHQIGQISLPADAPVAGTDHGVTTSWKIEVWGTGYFLASFMHPFPVDVYRGQRPDEQEEAGVDDESTTGGQ